MIVVMYGVPGHTLTSVAIRRTEVTIGSDHSADIVLSNAEPIHAQLVKDGSRWLVVTSAPVVINERELEGRFIIGAEDELRIAGYVLHVRPALVESREQELIANASADDDARLIYADWLEERGQWDRAEFLRLQQEVLQVNRTEPLSARHLALSVRLRKLSRALDIEWRMMVSRDDVEGCRSMTREFTCTMTWSALEPTAVPHVRSCRGCRQDVFYCATEAEAAAHSREGHCIVIDLGIERGELLERARQRAAEEAELDAAVTTPMPAQPPPQATMPPGMYLPMTYSPSASLPAVGLVQCRNCSASMTTLMQFCPVCAAPR